jgi:LPLT family lysophospholipid transporter-like MFS transporter
MTHTAIQNGSLFTRGMVAVLAAQFLSALADNALLFAAIALLKSQHAPEWQMPLLQEAFVESDNSILFRYQNRWPL